MGESVKLKTPIIWLRCLLIAICVLTGDSLCAQTKPAEERQNLLSQFSDSMDELTARVSPAVVQVVVTGYRAVEDKDQSETSVIARQRSLGSGVIVDSDGYIITVSYTHLTLPTNREV